MSEKVTFPQMMFAIVLFNFGSSVVIGISDDVAQDTWVAIVLAAVLAAPLFLVYARLFKLFPERDLFQIMRTVFGNVGGKILTVLFIWYTVHLAALVLRNFSEFTQITAMPETPQLPIMIIMILTTVYFARSGMRTIGKWSMVVVFAVMAVVFLTFVAAIPQLEFDILMPFFESPPEKIGKTTMQVFSYPYAETVVFLGLASSFKKKDSPYKLFIYSLLMVLAAFIVVFLRNVTLLGTTLSSLNYFPSYVTARIIGIGDFLARIEGSISSNFLFAGIVKITACLLVAGKGVASLFDLDHYRPVILPIGLLIMALCAILYKSTMEMFAFIAYYPFYAFPFQVLIPLIVWIGGEIHVKKQNQKQKQKQNDAAA
ncbi:MAG: GerAB/ArcD/ProY family transporter [Christensenellales bacterium]|jgi:spore germination protein KB